MILVQIWVDSMKKRQVSLVKYWILCKKANPNPLWQNVLILSLVIIFKIPDLKRETLISRTNRRRTGDGHVPHRINSLPKN